MRGIVLLVIGCVCVFALCLFVSCSDTKNKSLQTNGRILTRFRHLVSIKLQYPNIYTTHLVRILRTSKGTHTLKACTKHWLILNQAGMRLRDSGREFQLLPYPPKINYADDEP